MCSQEQACLIDCGLIYSHKLLSESSSFEETDHEE